MADWEYKIVTTCCKIELNKKTKNIYITPKEESDNIVLSYDDITFIESWMYNLIVHGEKYAE